MDKLCIPTIRGEIKKARVIHYDFSAGVFEFIDNAIDVGADKIRIDIRERSGSGNPHKILISDNTKSGIILKQLLLIFSWTYERPRTSADIGEYGTGFKTAAVNIADKLTILTKDGETNVCYQAIADWQDMSDEDRFEPKIMEITSDYYYDYHPFSNGSTFILEGIRNEMMTTFVSPTETIMTTLLTQLYNDIAYTYRYLMCEQKEVDIVIKGIWKKEEEMKECRIRDHELFTGKIDPVKNVKGNIIQTTIHVYKDVLQFFRVYYRHGEGKWETVQFIDKRKNGNNHLRSREISLDKSGLKCVDTLMFFTTHHQDADYSETCINMYPTCTIDIIRKGRIVGRNVTLRCASRTEPPNMFVKHEIWYNSYQINPLLGIQYNKQNNGWIRDNDLRYTLEYIQQMHERECVKFEKQQHPVPKPSKQEEIIVEEPTLSTTKRRNFSTQVKIQTLNRQECRDSILDFVLKDSVLLLEYDHKNGQPCMNTRENCQALSVITHSIKTHCPETFRDLESAPRNRVRYIASLLNCITRSKVFVDAYMNGHIRVVDQRQPAEMIQEGLFAYSGE